MKILHLTVKKKWYDMATNPDFSKRKLEEYRTIKPYWIRRLIDINYPEEEKGENKILPFDIEFDIIENGYDPFTVIKSYFSEFKHFDAVLYKNGYSPNSPTTLFECKGIDFGSAVPEWSDNWKGNVFRIKLGNIIK